MYTNLSCKVWLLFHLEILTKVCYNIGVRQGGLPFWKGSEELEEMNLTEAMLRAILELIDKCDTIEELRVSVKRILQDKE